MAQVALSLGSNIGDKAKNLRDALRALEAHPQIKILRASSFYQTIPWGKPDQDDFINAAAIVETTLAPEDLLSTCLGIEQQMGRARRERWGPRLIDIDLLTYDARIHNTARLTLPHPEMLNRAFVLVPLAEIDEHYKPMLRDLDCTGVVRLS